MTFRKLYKSYYTEKSLTIAVKLYKFSQAPEFCHLLLVCTQKEYMIKDINLNAR